MNEQQRVDNVIANANANADCLRARLADAEARLAKVAAMCCPLCASLVRAYLAHEDGQR